MQKQVKPEDNSLKVISRELLIDLKCPDGKELPKRLALKEPKRRNNLNHKIK